MCEVVWTANARSQGLQMRGRKGFKMRGRKGFKMRGRIRVKLRGRFCIQMRGRKFITNLRAVFQKIQIFEFKCYQNLDFCL